jgi:large subunit ribosomal protein L29
MAKKAAAKKASPKASKASKAKKPASAKASSKADDFRAKSSDELSAELTGLKKEQFNLRFQRANGQAENTGRIRVIRRNIARIETVLNEQRRASAQPKA